MTAADRLNEIEARANAATEGPWEAYRPNPAYRIYEICSTTPQGLDETLAEVSGYNASDDADFIAHARTDVPALMAALRAVLDLADRWAAQSTDYDEDTEQQIDDGKAIVRAIEEALS